MDLTKYSVKKLYELLTKKEVSSVEITNSYLSNMEKYRTINAFITETKDIALKMAQDSDNRIKKGEQKSKLDGIPLAIKDIFLTKNIKTTNGSKFYSEFIPPFESTVTQNLLNAGTVVLGKTNMDEFAMGSANLTSYFKPVVNPWRGKDNEDKVPGGSSGGSAAAVAANMAPMALGTDTGGSIRQPASFCGVVGMKPTYGTCSRFGIFAFSSSLDQAGPMTKTVEDNAMLLQEMAGYDIKDSTMVKRNKPNYTSEIGKDLKGLTVGVIKEYNDYKLNPSMAKLYKQTLKYLENEGVKVKEISFPHHNYVLPIYYIIAPVEAASNFSRYDGIRYGRRANGDSLYDIYANSRTEGWGDEVKTRILIGTYNLMSEHFHVYTKAAQVRALVTNDFDDIFKEVDFVITPTTASTAFNVSTPPKDPLEMYFNDIFTVTANLAGIPALSIPCGLSEEKLPLGVQLVGNYFEEPLLYKVASRLESLIGFNEVADILKK